MQEFYFDKESEFESRTNGDKSYVEVYDEQGRLITHKYHRGKVVVDGVRFVYNKKGQVIEKQHFRGNRGALHRVYFLSYNDEGNQISKKMMEAKGANFLPISEQRTTYDERNEVVEEVMLEYSDKSGEMEPVKRITLTYNEDGQLAQRETSDLRASDQLFVQSETDNFSYEDDKEIVINEINWKGEEKVTFYREETTFRSDGAIQEKVRYFKGKLEQTTRFEYDNEGRLTAKTTLNTEGNFDEKEVLAYQKDGKLLSKAVYQLGDTLDFKHGSRYLYHYH